MLPSSSDFISFMSFRGSGITIESGMEITQQSQWFFLGGTIYQPHAFDVGCQVIGSMRGRELQDEAHVFDIVQ